PAKRPRPVAAALGRGASSAPPVYPEAKNPFEAALQLLGRVNPMAALDGERLPNSFDVVVRILQIMQHELGNDRAGEADVLVNPDLRGYWVLEFWKAADIIEQGRRAAEDALPNIREKLAELRGATL